MRIFFFYIFIFYTSIFSGQILNDDALYYTDTSKHILSFKTGAYYGASQLSRDFVNVLVNGGEISSGMKDNNLLRADKLNRLGGELYGNFSYYNLDLKIFKQFGYYFGLKTHFSSALKYTDDIYESIFYGNSSFKGDTISLRRTGLHSREYHSAFFGLFKENIKFGLVYTSIFSEMNSYIHNGGIYSSQSGAELTSNVLGQMISTNNDNSNIQSGFGLGIDLEVRSKITFLDSSSNAMFVAGVSSFGLQFLGANTNTIVFDTSYTYRGIQISSLNDFSSTILPSDIIDSLSLQNENSSITSVLPFELYIHKVGGKLNSKIHSTYGLRYRSASNYTPLFYFGGEYLFNSNIVVGSIATYGGYSKFQLGSYFRWRSSSAIIAISTNNMLAFVSKNSSGMGVNLSLSYLMK